MRERKFVKFRVDMYDDTKFKIIDRKPERDLIHYVWNRVAILAGKVNLEGELYLSKTIPYTLETLAIEFNRDVDAVKSAFDVLMELEMVELTEDKVYKVKNFAKHQNIKVKEKDKLLVKEKVVDNKENEIKEGFSEKIKNSDDKDSDEKVIPIGLGHVKNNDANRKTCADIDNDLKSRNEEVSITNDYMKENKISDSSENSEPMLYKIEKNNKVYKKKKKDNICDIGEEKEECIDLIELKLGEYVLSSGEHIVRSFDMT